VIGRVIVLAANKLSPDWPSLLDWERNRFSCWNGWVEREAAQASDGFDRSWEHLDKLLSDPCFDRVVPIRDCRRVDQNPSLSSYKTLSVL